MKKKCVPLSVLWLNCDMLLSKKNCFDLYFAGTEVTEEDTERASDNSKLGLYVLFGQRQIIALCGWRGWEQIVVMVGAQLQDLLPGVVSQWYTCQPSHTVMIQLSHTVSSQVLAYVIFTKATWTFVFVTKFHWWEQLHLMAFSCSKGNEH